MLVMPLMGAARETGRRTIQTGSLSRNKFLGPGRGAEEERFAEHRCPFRTAREVS